MSVFYSAPIFFYVGVIWGLLFLCVWDIGMVSLFRSILSKDLS